ncbi:hypothetical protein [Methylobacterium sp. Leaf85]|uniref:hypothetical protein n=1 Tax=Methylobacterium sp. Leaf85 TaxID=1736241 RepID=UPI0006F9CC36|nr:hypothetical protein [Methylobacterium sp. Leaf85]KQO43441.1 hypothetical protein ASF08_08740 [Methylobacterium sp. Leaf85]
MASSSRGSIRAFQRSDIPQVCQLFSQTFRLGRSYRAAKLAACLEATYFDPPGYTEGTGSIVHLDRNGVLDGFMGVIAMTMVVGERTLRAGILSAYMAADPDNNPGIGVSLIRGVTARDFDLLFTDTANRTSLDIARATRFVILPAQSLEWVKIHRPAGTAAYFLGKRLPRLARWIVPMARAADSVIRRFLPSGFPRPDGIVSRPIAAADFAEAARPFLAHYDLKPDPTELGWFVEQAGLQTKYGPLQIREVVDRTSRRIGLYLLYARRDGVAYALQLLALPNREELVVGRMFADAAEFGAVAVRGATSPDLMKGLFRQKGLFYHHVMGTIAWTRDPEVAATLRGGNVFLGGIAGETWARIVTEDFS